MTSLGAELLLNWKGVPTGVCGCLMVRMCRKQITEGPGLRWWLLFSSSVVSGPLRPHGLQHIRFPHLWLPPGVCSNSYSLNQWCYLTISSSTTPFSTCLQSFPASGSFPMSQFFTSGGQSIGASASVLPMNTQDWLPLGWTGWISLQPKALSRVLQQHSSKASILWRVAFFTVQLLRLYMTPGKTMT